MEIDLKKVLSSLLNERILLVLPNGEEIKDMLKDVKIIAMGAEAIIAKAVFLDIDVIIKWRFPKPYMPQHLDNEFRKIRTSTEAKALFKSIAIGIKVPIPLYIDDDAGLLIMSFIDGVSLRDSMDSLSIENVCEVCRKIGLYVAKLHKNSIVHGDITTSNILLEKDSKNVYIIDFGLTNFTSRLEDQAIDVHIFFRSIESTQHNFEDLAKKCFIEGYRQIRGDYTEKVLETVNNIRKMGRYVAERKIKSIWRT